jgi:hypothetical protein
MSGNTGNSFVGMTVAIAVIIFGGYFLVVFIACIRFGMHKYNLSMVQSTIYSMVMW